MSVPVEYTDAVQSLKVFRKKILAELVASRVKAGLDASHDSMLKYRNLIDGLSITPMMFGKVREKALALKLGTRDLGYGEIYQLSPDYALGIVDYPLNPPYEVARRKLPQVDVFSYDLVSDLELMEKTDLSNLSSFIMLQAESGTFVNVAEAENAIYDYYGLFPQVKKRGYHTLADVDTRLTSYDKIEGEYILFRRDLVKIGTMDKYTVTLILWIDPSIFTTVAFQEHVAIAVSAKIDPSLEGVIMSVCGQRVPFTETGLHMTLKWADTPHGFIHICDTITEQSSPVPETVWKNHFKLTMEVNEPLWGHTTPTENTITDWEAMEKIMTYAVPHSGYLFDYWTEDGIKVSESETLDNFWIYKDTTLRAYFKPE